MTIDPQVRCKIGGIIYFQNLNMNKFGSPLKSNQRLIKLLLFLIGMILIQSLSLGLRCPNMNNAVLFLLLFLTGSKKILMLRPKDDVKSPSLNSKTNSCLNSLRPLFFLRSQTSCGILPWQHAQHC